jgi:hypothetical protein
VSTKEPRRCGLRSWLMRRVAGGGGTACRASGGHGGRWRQLCAWPQAGASRRGGCVGRRAGATSADSEHPVPTLRLPDRRTSSFLHALQRFSPLSHPGGRYNGRRCR